ncbi:MAG: YegS/Rv2252/BmrU family lipid kinase [Lachnospiraceae bacterium]|nr:YegS/Rv2252/BmrU family lipid kinase [Lachnospiraceae bacterium]
MFQKILLIYNPRAGKGLFVPKLADVVDMFVKAGYRVEVHPTQKQGDAIKVARRVSGYIDLLVVAGGDGTLGEVVTGLVASGRDMPIGYIPVGSTNDYAFSLNMSSSILEATGDIVGGEPQAVDIGRFNNKIFVYVAAFGLFTDVSYDTNQDMKNLFGHLAYIFEGMRRIGDIKTYPLHVEVEGNVHEGDYIYGMVTNSVSVGGFRGMTGKDIYLDDGVFEMMLIHTPTNPMELNELITALMTGDPESTSMIEYYHTDHIEISSSESIPWTLDGEYGGKHSNVVIQNMKQRVRMILYGDKSQVLHGWRDIPGASGEDEDAEKEFEMAQSLRVISEEFGKMLDSDL